MTNETRSPEEIEREIERERAGLTDTLDDLQDRFSVEYMARQVTDQFREHGGDIGRSVSEAVKRNPLALALTGVGLAWLMTSDRSAPRRRVEYGHPDYDRIEAARARAKVRFAHDDDYERDLEDRLERTDPYDRPGARPGRPVMGPSPSSYYSRHHAQTRDVPAWARVDDSDDSDDESWTDKAKDRASEAGDRISGAASSAAGSARAAGSGAADKARQAGQSVSEAGQSAKHRAQDAAGTAKHRAQDAASRARARAERYRRKLAQGTEDLSDEARQRVIAARERAMDARDRAMRQARRGADRAADLFEEQPMIGGAIALAIGAALGAALPRSDMEDRYMGEQSDALMDEAERIFEEETQKLRKVADAAADEAGKVARETKRELDDKASSDTAADAAADKAKKAGERVADAAKSEAKKQDLGDVKKS
ncbi:DUF3618 domain-containing protein [Marivita sp. GX14005]|uniref:DUF3618 domain-containing protein n=1 Tax=Marivita sp. GX14005 TaxID=2942276 RepID=UPI0020199AF0|nr:DUF3618 domain-containing protein [Marivita sp. GX14005]MCL3883904.1 DUF3618 domain-containing protein [Marivita sp. GX14005]